MKLLYTKLTFHTLNADELLLTSGSIDPDIKIFSSSADYKDFRVVNLHSDDSGRRNKVSYGTTPNRDSWSHINIRQLFQSLE